MKYLPFVFKHLRRNWVRTGSTVVAMAVCIFLLCTLRSVLAEVTACSRRPPPRVSSRGIP
jgi:cell division protein FtsX